MKKIMILLIIGLTSIYSNATEICKSNVPQTNLVNIFLFNNGLQAVCQKVKNEITSDNKNICANDSFLMTSFQNSGITSSFIVSSSYYTGVTFTNKQSSKSRTMTLDKVYRVKVISGAKEIVIQPGTFAMECQTK